MRNVIVTGGSRGLGLGVARVLKGAGYNVVAIARHKSEELSALMRENAPGRAGAVQFRPFDLADIPGIPKFVKSLRSEFGSSTGSSIMRASERAAFSRPCATNRSSSSYA